MTYIEKLISDLEAVETALKLMGMNDSLIRHARYALKNQADELDKFRSSDLYIKGRTDGFHSAFSAVETDSD